MIPTTNVLQRTMCIKAGTSIGTAFTVDRDGRQYVVTARHVVKDLAPDGEIEVRRNRQWEPVPVSVVGVGTGETDVTILKPNRQLTPSHPLEPSIAGIVYGQQVFFLGFPYGWDSGAESINNGYPVPFVKAGIVSALIMGDTTRIYIDAHSNPGFSGGPLVFRPPGQPSEHKVAGVIVGSQQDPITKDQAGFVLAISIKHAAQMIDEVVWET